MPNCCTSSLRLGDSIMAAASLQHISERRSNHRYPVAVAMEYRAVLDNRGVVKGSGATINLSSAGVLFETSAPLPAGVSIELDIEWPTKLNDTVPLKLHAKGKTIRTQGGYTAVGFSRTEFRTRATRSVVCIDKQRLPVASNVR